jgi:hypothetical protein
LRRFALTKQKIQFFFPEKEEKKDMLFQLQLRLAAVKVFWKKILPGA